MGGPEAACRDIRYAWENDVNQEHLEFYLAWATWTVYDKTGLQAVVSNSCVLGFNAWKSHRLDFSSGREGKS